MSDQNSAHVAGSVNAGMSVGGSKPPGRARLHVKLLGVVFFVLVIVAVAAWYVLWRSSSSSPVPAATSSAAAAGKLPAYFSTLNSQEQVSYYLSQKNYMAAIAIYNNQLKTARTADGSAQANLGISAVYTTEQNYQLAYQYAQKAYGDEVTIETAMSAGGAADQAGDKAGATKYYQTAINILPKENLPADQYAYQLRELQADIQGSGQ